MLGKTKSKIKLPELRSWNEFFKFNGGFRYPDPEKLNDRVACNLLYYQANYLFVPALFLLYVVVARPIFLIALLLVAGGAVYLFQIRDQPFVINQKPLKPQQVKLIFGVGTLVILMLFGGTSCLVALLLSLLVVVLHATFRKRSLKSRGTTFVDLWRGTTPLGHAMRQYEQDDPEMGSPKQQEKMRQQQAEFRAKFTAKMRSKYMKKAS